MEFNFPPTKVPWLYSGSVGKHSIVNPLSSVDTFDQRETFRGTVGPQNQPRVCVANERREATNYNEDDRHG